MCIFAPRNNKDDYDIKHRHNKENIELEVLVLLN